MLCDCLKSHFLSPINLSPFMVFSWSMGLSSWCGLLLPFLLMWTVTLDVGRKTMNSQQAQQQYQPFTVSLASWLSFFVCFLGVSLSESQHSQAKALLQVCYGNRIEWPTVELFLLINVEAFSGRLGEPVLCYLLPACLPAWTICKLTSGGSGYRITQEWGWL